MAPRAPKERVLILDGNVEECALLMDYLQRSGYEAVITTSVQHAREALEHQQFTLLLLDAVLPDGDGLQLCHELREHLGLDTVIVFVSREVAPLRKVVALQLGADDFITKPFDPRELLARIEVQLRRYYRYLGCKKRVSYRDRQVFG